ncbi:MAG: hypothetical protein IPL84_13990 [Chitinophagaceae bacterium]|nr:hypothetical protein [Chitinophagaceae bacterium]
MKRVHLLLVAFSIVIATVISCKTVGRIAAKYWLNREIKEFVAGCEDKASLIIGSEKAHKYCDCSVDLVAEQYHNYQDAKKISVMEIIDFINKCK